VILPIFADEAIYIRWAQLIIDEPARYLFFALNDGKTPLFIWLQIPFIALFNDPLFAARLVSVIVGFLQVLLMGVFARMLFGTRKAEILAMLLTTILPFWFFHHRMALMDALMTLFLTMAWYSLFKMVHIAADTSQIFSRSNWKKMAWLSTAGLSFGLALWSKLPAVLLIPPFFLTALSSSLTTKKNELLPKQLIVNVVSISLSVALGLTLLAALKISPAFGQLFARGSDFLYSPMTILSGGWKQTLPNLFSYLNYLWQYLTWPVLVLSVMGLFLTNQKGIHHTLFWSAVLFLLPISIMGKVVYPRYFLPIAVPLTLLASSVLAELVDNWIVKSSSLKFKLAASILVVSFLGGIANLSALFILPAIFQPNSIPFVSADRVQYLTEWSSGHGVVEAVALIQTLALDHTVAVATEGYFGTLPDAITDYLHNQDVSNLYVEGIGQPVLSIPSSFMVRAREYDQVLLVVNDHRLGLGLDLHYRLASYCRPWAAPCLEIWDISHLVKVPELE
jgi:4-amino-4-deoxy-L-arabinose transferase-like glycosyltransferase